MPGKPSIWPHETRNTDWPQKERARHLRQQNKHSAQLSGAAKNQIENNLHTMTPA